VNITVTNPANVPPTVAITSPAGGFSTENSTLTISATAGDTDGTIAKVEFFQGSTEIGEDTTAPYSFNWTGIAVGSYALTAKATDNDGAVTTSSTVSVTFTPPGAFNGSHTQNFDSMGAAGTTPPGTWSVKNGEGSTSNSTWTSSIAAGTVATMVNAASASLTVADSPTGNNVNGYNAGSGTNRMLASAPTGVAGMAFQLVLTNTTGYAIEALRVSYDTVRFNSAGSNNELPGYWLFYSLDNGATWVNASALNPTISTVPNSAGTTVTPPTVIALATSWAHNTPLLLRWVDDNAQQTSPDQIIGLDNVSIQAEIIDTDDDGLPDSWEVANGTNPNANDLTSNTDGDASNALQEFGFGTNAQVNDSVPLVITGGNTLTTRGTPVVSLASNGTAANVSAVFCRRRGHALLGLTYTVQFSANLSDWFSSSVTPVVIATDGDIEAVRVPYPFFVGGRKAQFFRVNVSLP
jgi:hypothetical protein